MKLISARITGYQNRTFFELFRKLFAKRVCKFVNFFRRTQKTSNHALPLLPAFYLFSEINTKLLFKKLLLSRVDILLI